MSGSVSFFVPDDVQFTAYDTVSKRIIADLAAQLPPDCDIRHIGATAIRGLMTKGDIDLVVRVKSAADFEDARARLSGILDLNEGSLQNDTLASFVTKRDGFDIGVQLVLRSSPYDTFHALVDILTAEPVLRDEYTALKSRHQGGDMDAYRTEKSAWIENVLNTHKGKIVA